MLDRLIMRETHPDRQPGVPASGDELLAYGFTT
jgi:hypothetical protein